MLYRNRLLCFHSGVWLWFVFGWCCVVCFAWLLFVLSSFVCFVSAWWIRGIADEVSIASFCKAVTGTAVMARSANEEKKKKHLEETDASGSRDSPCRAVFLRPLPKLPQCGVCLDCSKEHWLFSQ